MFKNLFEVEKVEFDDKDMQEAYYRGMRDGEANNEISNALIMAGTGIMTAICILIFKPSQYSYEPRVECCYSGGR